MKVNKLKRSLNLTKNKGKIASTLFSLMVMMSSMAIAATPVDELRAELQENSQFITANFNTWQNIRKQIIENKNKILEHRRAMQTCLASLYKAFDEKLFNSCSVNKN